MLSTLSVILQHESFNKKSLIRWSSVNKSQNYIIHLELSYVFILMRFLLPKRLKKDVISCDWMANVGDLDLVILAQHKPAGRWLG